MHDFILVCSYLNILLGGICWGLAFAAIDPVARRYGFWGGCVGTICGVFNAFHAASGR